MSRDTEIGERGKLAFVLFFTVGVPAFLIYCAVRIVMQWN